MVRNYQAEIQKAINVLTEFAKYSLEAIRSITKIIKQIIQTAHAAFVITRILVNLDCNTRVTTHRL